jgi:hypothetical protein
MSYRVGELVRVKPRAWFDGIRGGNYPVRNPDGYGILFVRDMEEYCGKILEVCDKIRLRTGEEVYYLAGALTWYWKDWMLEPFAIENVKECAL